MRDDKVVPASIQVFNCLFEPLTGKSVVQPFYRLEWEK